MNIVFDNNGEPLGTFEDGVCWAIERFEALLLVSSGSVTSDSSIESYEADVDTVIRGVLSATKWLAEHTPCAGEGSGNLPS